MNTSWAAFCYTPLETWQSPTLRTQCGKVHYAHSTLVLMIALRSERAGGTASASLKQLAVQGGSTTSTFSSLKFFIKIFAISITFRVHFVARTSSSVTSSFLVGSWLRRCSPGLPLRVRHSFCVLVPSRPTERCKLLSTVTWQTPIPIIRISASRTFPILMFGNEARGELPETPTFQLMRLFEINPCQIRYPITYLRPCR